MDKKLSELAKDLKPYVLSILDEMSNSTGEGGMTPSPHELDSSHHIGMLADSQAPQFLKTDGSRDLIGHLNVAANILIDGVDLDVLQASYNAHILNPHAHHLAFTALQDDTNTVVLPDGAARIKISGGNGLSSVAGPNLLTINLDTPGTLSTISLNAATSPHTHAIDNSFDPGAAAKILATDSAGRARLRGLSVGSASLPGAVGDLAMSGMAVINGELHLQRTAGATEVLLRANVSDDPIARINLENVSGVAGKFVPGWRSYGSGTDEALWFIGNIQTDTGANPAFVFDARTQTPGTIGTRPLLDIRNFGALAMRVGANRELTLYETLNLTKTAEPGSAEILFKATITDDAVASFQLDNKATTNGMFVPRLLGVGSGTQSSLYLSGYGTTDSGAEPVILIDSRKADLNVLTTRPLLEVRNATNVQTRWLASGNLEHYTGAIIVDRNAQAGTAEVLFRGIVSDDGIGSIELNNSTTLDGVFQPRLQGISQGNLYYGLYLQGRITTDTGSVPAVVIDGRNTNNAALVNRDILHVRSGNTTFLILEADGDFRVTSGQLTVTNPATQLSLNYDGANLATFTVGANGNLTVIPTGDFIFDPVGNDVRPEKNYDLNLGFINKKWLTIHAAELWVETLVAQETIATIGGRILVGPTTTYAEDAVATRMIVDNETFGAFVPMGFLEPPNPAAGKTYTIVTDFVERTNSATLHLYVDDGSTHTLLGSYALTRNTIDHTFTGNQYRFLYKVSTSSTVTFVGTASVKQVKTKHNNLFVNDIIYTEADGYVEFMQVTSGPTGTGPFTYIVTRDLDGTGANTWYAGDAIFNTGVAGVGFIDQYSLHAVGAHLPDYIYNYNNGAAPSPYEAGIYSQNYRDSNNWTLFGDNAGDAVNDGIYFGLEGGLWNNLYFQFGTAGTPSGVSYAWEYWNGAAWTLLPVTMSGTFASTGAFSVEWAPPVGWRPRKINGTIAYWVRVRITAFGSFSTKPVQKTRRVFWRKRTFGPTIAMNVRNSTTFNDWSEHAAFGNLNGYYDYGADTYGFAAGKWDGPSSTTPWISADATQGFRVMRGSTKLAQWDTAGNILIGQQSPGQSNSYISAGGIQLRNNTIKKVDLQSDGDVLIGDDTSAPLTTFVAVFSNNQTYNAEGMTAGDVLMGTNDSGHGNLKFESAGGLRMRQGTITKAHFQADGDVFLGSNVAATGSTYLSIFANAQSYNAESFSAGDLLIGFNGANVGNVLITGSGVFRVRSGSVVKFEANTGGNVHIGSNVATPATTTLVAFGSPTSYNGEPMVAGDVLFGNNSPATQNIKITSAGAFQVRRGQIRRFEVDTIGNLYLGTDLSTVAGTHIGILAGDTSYNGELISSGDMLIGDNSANKANVLWDRSEGRLKFRGGMTTHLFIDTTGTLVAGQGKVTLNNVGLVLSATAGGTPDALGSVTWKEAGGTTIGSIGVSMDSIQGRNTLFLVGHTYQRTGAVSLLADVAEFTLWGIENRISTTARIEMAGGLTLGPSSWNPGAGNILAAGPTSQFGYHSVVSGAVLNIGNPNTNYPANAGWNTTFNANLVLHGLDWTSIGFHDASHSVGVIRYGNGWLELGPNVGWSTNTVIMGSLAVYRDSTYRQGYITVPLAPPAKDTSAWWGHTKTITGWTAINLQAAPWNLPASIKGVHVRLVGLAQTEVASNGGYLQLGSSNGGDGVVVLWAHDNTKYKEGAQFIPTDANGDIWYQVVGTTWTNVYLLITGYVI